MYTLISFVIILILSSSSSLVDAQCSASVSAQPRQGSSWTSNGVSYQLYDISVENTGSSAITSLYAYFGYPSGTSVSSSFNYDSSTGEITGFGASLAPQASSTSAGFTLAGPGTPTLAYTTPICAGSSPSAPTAAPTDAPTQENCFNQCTSDQVCVALSSAGPTCNPRSCSDLQCGTNQVCIDDGGVARCITTESGSGASRRSPTAAPTQAPTEENCYNQCSADEVCVALTESGVPTCNPQSCSALSCESDQVCIDDGGVARCITTGTNAPTPAPTAENCNNQCSSDQVCVALSEGDYECHYTNCDDLTCGSNSVCINDGGVARCITESTPAPTPAPTAGPALTAASDTCVVSLSAVPRPNGSYMQGGALNQVWDLVFTSHGSATIKALDVVVSLGAGASVSQQWNMSPLGSGSIYSVSTYGALNANGAAYYGAGFVVTGSAGVNYVSVSSVSCN